MIFLKVYKGCVLSGVVKGLRYYLKVDCTKYSIIKLSWTYVLEMLAFINKTHLTSQNKKNALNVE